MYSGSRSPEQICRLYLDRQKAQDPVLARMASVREQYNGDVIVPLPELDRDERSAVANLLQQGLDNYGRRIASVTPNLTCPPTNPRLEGSKKKADIRRRATLSWWETNRVSIKLRRRARWLVGYGSAPVAIRPDFVKGIARWEPRNPLWTFPAQTLDPDDLVPDDVIYAVKRPLSFIRDKWPDASRALCGPDENGDKTFTILEYDDAEQACYIVMNDEHYIRNDGMAEHMMLDCVPNRTGLPLSVVPGRVTLDRPSGQFDGILGMYQMQAKLMALEVHAVQRGVFPDTYLISRANETAKYLSGPHAGSTGLVNIVEGGDVHTESPNPGFATNATIDRLERAQRVEGGISPDMSGESGSNIRTGRRGDSIMSALVDFPVQEAQEMLAASLEEENRRATKIARNYFGNAPKSFYVSLKGGVGQVDYTPNVDFDSDYTQVAYSMAGADVQNLTIGVGQLVGTEMMSADTGRKIHPWIDDANLEGDKVVAEGLRKALMQGIQNQAAQGGLPPSDLARIIQLVVGKDMDFEDAVLKVQKEAQERQAAMPPDPAAAGADPAAAVDPNSPAAQPGLALPGAGAEAGTAVPEPSASLSNLDSLFMKLRGTAPAA